ncbi:hypothetical protein CISIN_1g015891mg [Citrus sinensis]|uniref:NB-ARC domain-containing protein n=1 Tax=Citrus sinensis TaxID=2711 RepID=A0A067ED85_CITSI|nr:hypothetical protein CISIN_1g015891mg [Citrus sinensis]
MGQVSQNGEIGGSSSDGGDKSKPEETNVPKVSKSKPPANVHGFANEELHLQKLLSNRGTDDQFRAIGVVGVAGVGKTTLCQRIFHKPDVKTQFVPRIWVCTMSGQKTAESIVKRILKRLGVDDGTTNSFEGQGLAFLDYVLQQQLIGKRYLIVLDDFEDMEVCKHLSKVLPRGYGERLIITSRNEKLTTEMVGEENLHQLQPLSDQESCWLIYRDSVRDKDAQLKSQARKDLEEKLEKLQGQNEDAVNFPSSKQLVEELGKLQGENTKLMERKRSILRDSANLPNSKQLEEEVEKLQGQITKMIEEKRAKQREQRKNAEELKRKCGGLPLAAKLLGEIKAQEELRRKEKLLKDILDEIERVVAANRRPEPETQEQDAQTPATEGESNSVEPTGSIVNA